MKKIIPLSLFLFLFPVLAIAQTHEIIRRIEMQRGLWINLSAELKLEFTTPEGRKAHCRAELYYHRLDEKILLKGFNDAGAPLFVFKTDDREFSLYLASSGTVFSGSIFDLEDSPAIHSHLKALDLYRALKPLALREEKTDFFSDGNGYRLEIRGENGQERTLFADKSGNTVREVYEKPGVKKQTVIERNLFENQKYRGGSFAFPKVISIRSFSESSDIPSKTILTFEKIDFLRKIQDEVFEFHAPEDAKRIDISEEFKEQVARTAGDEA